MIPEVLARWCAITLGLLLASCSASTSHTGAANKYVMQTSASFQSLEDALRADLNVHLPNNYPAETRARVANCLATGMVMGIPSSDQSQMLAAYNTRQVSPEVDDLFVKWLNRSMLHGPIAKPDWSNASTYQGGTLHYADGTPAKSADPARGAAIKTNVQSVCPDLAPDIYRLGDN